MRSQNLRKEKLNPKSIEKAIQNLTNEEKIEFLTALLETKDLKKRGHEVRINNPKAISGEIRGILERLLREVPRVHEKSSTS